MKRRWLNLCFVCVSMMMLAGPTTALAARDEPEHDVYDARLEGYAGNVTLPGGGAAMCWVAFVFLGIVTCAGLFKDAKRSHLD